MFEAGKTYTINIYETGAMENGLTTIYRVRIVEVQMPLIKAIAAGQETIFNTNSPAFFSAERQD